jgi:hypothetical protein
MNPPDGRSEGSDTERNGAEASADVELGEAGSNAESAVRLTA